MSGWLIVVYAARAKPDQYLCMRAPTWDAADVLVGLLEAAGWAAGCISDDYYLMPHFQRALEEWDECARDNP